MKVTRGLVALALTLGTAAAPSQAPSGIVAHGTWRGAAIADDPPAARNFVVGGTVDVTARSQLPVRMLPQGGFVMQLQPQP